MRIDRDDQSPTSDLQKGGEKEVSKPRWQSDARGSKRDGTHLPEEDAPVWSSAGHVDPVSADSHSREPNGRDQPMLDRFLRTISQVYKARDQLPSSVMGPENEGRSEGR